MENMANITPGTTMAIPSNKNKESERNTHIHLVVMFFE